MIRYHEALKKIREVAHAKADHFSILELPLEEALGRVVGSTVLSPTQVPPFNNSAMDGFALRSQETKGAEHSRPKTFSIQGMIAAGDKPRSDELRQAACTEIMTGAPLPEDFDSVVKCEDVTLLQNGRGEAERIQVSREIKAKENVRFAGEDFRKGDPVLDRGQVIQPEHVLALATLGISQLPIFRRPSAAILSTGTELVDYRIRGELEPGKIRNSTAPFLHTALLHLGADVQYHGILPDKPQEFLKQLELILSDTPDIIVTTGAVSMGRFDFIKDALHDLKADILFHKVAIRPGKPILFARLKKSAFFGLPGNTVSTVVGLRFFVEPYLRELLGISPELPVHARLEQETPKPEGLRCFFKAEVEIEEGALYAKVLPGQASFMVSPLLTANAWAVLPEEPFQLNTGTMIEVFPLCSSVPQWKGRQFSRASIGASSEP